MKFCQDHWERMRKALDDRKIGHLVAQGGGLAIAQIANQLETRDVTPENFDPLMSMHWAIAGNAIDTLGRSAGYLLSCPEGDEDPIDVSRISDPALKAKYLGKKWPLCPICYCNITHELTCRETRCVLPRENGYDWMIARAADDALDQANELGLLKES